MECGPILPGLGAHFTYREFRGSMEPSTCGSQGKFPHVDVASGRSSEDDIMEYVVCIGEAPAEPARAFGDVAAAAGVPGSLLGVSAAREGEGGWSCGTLCERRGSSEAALEAGRLISPHCMLPGRREWKAALDVGDCGTFCVVCFASSLTVHRNQGCEPLVVCRSRDLADHKGFAWSSLSW
mmetsp:Transcript_11636/g.30870  ORF Transcript_11636/g.30870 Transcript_11636/m.30870 type:complete len:181 (+) Transcript_11636:196-738(+)